MIDNLKKTDRLLAALKALLPFEIELTPAVAQHLQNENVDVADRMHHIVSKVSYAGDEGGILCHIVAPEERDALFVSLTHVRVARSMPLAAAVYDYQKHRVKKLKKQGRS